MSLPELNSGIRYKIKLPVSGLEFEIRPYLVKEEKILLSAMESERKSDIIQALRTVLKTCTFGQDIEDLSWTDIAYLLLKMKMYSAGEIVTLHIKCHNLTNKKLIDQETGEILEAEQEGECGQITDLLIDLDKEVNVDTSKVKDNVIKLTDSVTLMLRPPRFKLIDRLLDRDTQTDISFDALAACIDAVIVDDEIIRDFTPKEAHDFIDSFNSKQLIELKEYIASLPQLEIHKDFKCKTCGYEQKMLFRNLEDFFTE